MVVDVAVVFCSFDDYDVVPFANVVTVVKVNNTNSVNTLETNLNGNKQMIPSERAQKTVKNEPKNTQNH